MESRSRRPRGDGPSSVGSANLSRHRAFEHFPLRHDPPPQSLSTAQSPSGELAHLPLRHEAPPQSLFTAHEPPAAVAHLPLRQLTPLPQSLSTAHPPLAAAHLPLRQDPLPQSLSVAQSPSGAFAHLPLRHEAPPQSLFVAQLDPAAVAHFPLRHETPAPQSELVAQSATTARPESPSRATPGDANTHGKGTKNRAAIVYRSARRIDVMTPFYARSRAPARPFRRARRREDAQPPPPVPPRDSGGVRGISSVNSAPPETLRATMRPPKLRSMICRDM